jgi:hypothetical protein
MNYTFTGSLIAHKAIIDYCQKFRDESLAQTFSSHCWNGLCANIRDALPDSFLKFGMGEVAMEHGGLVLAQNNLVKIVVRQIDGCKAYLGVVVAEDCRFPQFAIHHMDGYYRNLYEALYHMGYGMAALPVERLQSAA